MTNVNDLNSMPSLEKRTENWNGVCVCGGVPLILSLGSKSDLCAPDQANEGYTVKTCFNQSINQSNKQKTETE